MSVKSLVIAAGTGAVLVTGLVLAGPAFAATGTVHTTSGRPLTVRASASTGAAVKGSVANGAKITIDCQTHGSSVKGKYGTSTVWDHVPAKHGYVSDAYVYTGSDGAVAPTCGKSTPPTSSATCSTSGLHDPRTCAQAVAWAKAHIGSTAFRVGTCDHVVGLAYGWSNSGSVTAAAHWGQVPAKDKHAGSRSAPAGALAFFSGGSHGYGHVMLSLGGGKFASTDVGTNGRYDAGRYGTTTIATIESSFGEDYLGWTQPWFNH